MSFDDKACYTCKYFLHNEDYSLCNTCTNCSNWVLMSTVTIPSKYPSAVTATFKKLPSKYPAPDQGYNMEESVEDAEDLVGKKYDSDKLDWTLLPWKEVEQVVEILEFGAKKYSRDNWKHVEPERYKKAAFRHLISYASGQKEDSESGKSHLAHLICNALFLMWNDSEDGN